MYEQEPKKQVNIPMAIFLVAQIIFIILLVVSLPQLFKSNEVETDDIDQVSKMEVKDLGNIIPEVSPNWISMMERDLFEIALYNSESQTISNNFAAQIREDTIKFQSFEYYNIDYFSAIVDIPDLEQSYFVATKYSSNNDGERISYGDALVILCIDDNATKIYPNFDCKNLPNSTNYNDLVAGILSYMDFEKFSAYIEMDNLKKVIISPGLIDLDESTQSSYIEQVKNAIFSLGVSPNLFDYYILKPEDSNYLIPEEYGR